MKPKPWTRWTEQELAVLQAFLSSLPPPYRPPHGYTVALRVLLPNRQDQDIRNGFNILRRKLARICNCGQPLPSASTTRCPTCTQVTRDRRSGRLAQGLCGTCGQKLGLGSSSTMCPSCRERHQKYLPAQARRFREQHGRQDRTKTNPLASQRILPWPACGHSRWMAELAAATPTRPVIDLFGGTGELLRLVAAFGGKAHAYYDLDPRIANLVAHAVHGFNLTPEADALIYPPGLTRKNRATRTRRLKLLGDTLRPTNVECRDALDVLKDANQPKNAIFLADPPWPGTDHPACARVDHHALLDALLHLPEGQDFILSLGAERQALEIAAKHLPSDQPKGLYWRRSGPYGVRGFLILSHNLQTHTLAQPLTPVTDFSKYGL